MAQGKTIYTVELAEKICAEYATGRTITQICKEMKLPYTTLWEWINKDYDGLAKKWKDASAEHQRAAIDELINLVRRDSDLIFFDDKHKAETSLVRTAIEARAKYLQFISNIYNPNSSTHIFGVDLKHCKTAIDVQQLLFTQADKLNKSQIDTLMTIFTAMLKAEEQNEIKGLLDQALTKLAKLEEGKNG